MSDTPRTDAVVLSVPEATITLASNERGTVRQLQAAIQALYAGLETVGNHARQLERELTRSNAAVIVALERALNDDATIADLVAALECFAKWRRPSKRDWDNGAVQDEFDSMRMNLTREQIESVRDAKYPWAFLSRLIHGLPSHTAAPDDFVRELCNLALSTIANNEASISMDRKVFDQAHGLRDLDDERTPKQARDGTDI